jgi:pimeloyl-ACP methyl ester carboxylesterase
MKVVSVFIAVWSCLITAAQDQKIDSSEITLPVKKATISATIYAPATPQKPPVVLIIAGSGPTDRNGNSPALPGKNNCLLQLAEVLAQNGIASLRYDKRMIGKSRLAQGMREDSLVFSDMIDDGEQLYHFLKNAGYKEIYIAGHSEGSLIGMVIAQRVKPTGYISIAGSGRKAPDILREQLATFPGQLKTDSYTIIDSLEAGHLVKKVNPSLLSAFRPSVQPYMISWFSYDPAKIISSLKCRILILQGSNDLQVKEKDADALKQGNPNAKLVIIKNMNHVLKEVKSGDQNENVKAYSNPDLAVMRELTDEIINFIKEKNQ